MNDHLSSPAAPFVVVHDALATAAPANGALNGAVLALGNFEGVHRGHHAVIDAALARARALRRPVAAMTFEPHPRAFFNPDARVFRLTDVATKLRLLASTGLNGAIVMRFDAALAALTAEAFIAQVLVERYAVAGVAVGYDFHFGKGRAGTPDFLVSEGRRLGFAVDIVPAFRDGSQRVSSGAIRDALTQGDVGLAARLLGYPWFVTGVVEHGDRRGRELGFPTANLVPDDALVVPGQGVFAAFANGHPAAVNVGVRPTFESGRGLLVESHLIDFDEDIYGQNLRVAFVRRLRGEKRFPSSEELIEAMRRDVAEAREVCASFSNP